MAVLRHRGHRRTVFGRADALGVAAVLGAACAPLEPAPSDLDGLFHYFWQKAEAGTDAELAEATTNASAAIAASDLEAGPEGSLTDITRDEIALVGMSPAVEPSLTAGMYLAGLLPCSLDQVERIVYALDQDALYDDAYETYQRGYDGGDAALDAYVDRESATLAWTSTIGSTLLGAEFDQVVRGLLRYVPDAGEGGVGSPVLVARYHMPSPAEFDDGSFFFDQDYQVEVYWERRPGEVVHLYGLWRRMGFGSLSTDDEGIVSLILDGLRDWDEQTAALCEGGY